MAERARTHPRTGVIEPSQGYRDGMKAVPVWWLLAAVDKTAAQRQRAAEASTEV